MKHLHRLLYPPAWSIYAKISVALLCAAIAPMGFTTYYNLQQSLESVEKSEYRKLELLATSTASRLDQLIVDIQRLLEQVSTERYVVGFLSSTTLAKQQTFRSDLQRTLENVFYSHPDFDAIFVMDKQGRCLAATDPTFVGENYAFREYFRSSIQGRSYISSILVGQTTRRPGLFFSNPVRSDSGKIVGVVVLKIRGENIWAIVNALQVGSEGYAFLVDQQGVIISHPDRSFLYHSLATLPTKTQKQVATDKRYGIAQIESLNIPALAAAMVGAKETGHTSYYSPLEQTYQSVGFAPLEVQPWVLGVNKPKAQFAAPLNRLIWQNSISVLTVGAIAAIVALLLARSIARPIRSLTAAAQALEHDDFDPHVLELRKTLAKVSDIQDDIGQLVSVFLEMAEGVRMRDQKLKMQVLELRIEIDETKKACHVAEITETDYFQQLQKKVRTLKERTVKTGETETDYFQQLQKKVQNFKGRAIQAGGAEKVGGAN